MKNGIYLRSFVLLAMIVMIFANCASFPKTQPGNVYQTTPLQIEARKAVKANGGLVEVRVIGYDTTGYSWSKIYTDPYTKDESKIVGNAAIVTPVKYNYTRQDYETGFALVQVEYAFTRVNSSVMYAGVGDVYGKSEKVVVQDWAIVPTTVEVEDVMTLSLGHVSSTEESSTFEAPEMLYSTTSLHAPAPKKFAPPPVYNKEHKTKEPY